MTAEITEIVQLDATRVDAVKNPANGFPILMMKAVNPQGGIDETPDIDGAENVLQCLARLIQSEASEMAVGRFDEVCDIGLLMEAAHCMRCFLQAEQMGAGEDDGEPIAKELEETAAYLVKRKVSAAERKRLASEGNALSDGSYPIANAEDLHNAAVLARSGHGDVAAAKRLIAKRARELGVANPLSKETMSDVETSTSEGGEVEKETDSTVDVNELVKSAVAEANKSSEERFKTLEDQLAKVLATPIPGGPVMTAPPHMRDQVNKAEKLAEAARFNDLAEKVTDPDLKRFYKERADVAKSAA